jgi:hypothetical protein
LTINSRKKVKKMKKHVLSKIIVLITLLFACTLGIAQPSGISLPTSSPYSENFNTTPGSSGSTYPSGWGSNNNGGWDASMTVGSSSSTTGANYNYSSSIGVLGSGTNFDPSYIILVINNTTGKTGLKISYDVLKIREQTRSCTFDLQISTTSATSGFSSVSGGAYASGSIAQGTATSYSNIDISALDNKSSTVYIRWYYASSGSGSRDGIALDNVSISWAAGVDVNTPAVANIVDSTATLSANLSSNGGTTIIERGFVWATTTNPLAGGSGVTKVTVAGTGTGAFDSTITDFPAGTRIYFKGYARNSGGYYYTSQLDFITQSAEPTAYPSSFTATAQTKNSIKLDWTQVSGANGYLIVQRQAFAPTGTPSDKTAYTVSQTLGDGQIVGFIPSGATTTLTVNGLLQGTRYYYTLFPFGYNGSNVQTYNYRTVPTIPLATDSTLGLPPSYKSTIEGVPASEAAGISSVINDVITTNANGTQVWKLRVKDGGATMNDADDLPTTVTRIMLNKGQKNTVANWQSSILSAGLIDDSTGLLIANGVITANTIAFNNITVTALDDNYRPLSVRLSLKKVAHTDRDTFQFMVDSVGTLTKTAFESSQTQAFVSFSDSSKNTIDVDATKLRFTTQPQATVEAGAYLSNIIRIEAVDTFNTRDIDFNGAIQLSATDANLIGTHTLNAVKGLVEFDTVRFNKISLADTLIATSGVLLPASSNKFAVEASKGSDIIADGGFVYPKNIVHTNYNDTDAITLSNSLEVMSFFLRDGGNYDDNDFETTTLTALTLNTHNAYLIRKAALYSGTTKVAQLDSFVVAGSNNQLVFTGLNIEAPDNDSAKISLRVTFNDSAIDGDNFGFTVVSATDNAATSQFATADAGGAASLTTGNNNSVDVVGRIITLLQQPTDVPEGCTQLPTPMVAAMDSLGNTDLASRNYTVKVWGTSTFDFRAIKAVNTITNGSATFGKLIYNTPSTGVKISVHTTGLDSVLSNPFEVTNPTWFRTVQSGNWMDTLTWETSTDYGTNWIAATLAPDYTIHGQITVRTGHTVQMDGTTPEANTVDEVTVETGAELITPQGAFSRLTVVDGAGADLIIEGKLIHSNPIAGNGIDITAPASVLVKTNGIIELAAFGDAAHWAGNTNIRFEDGAYYVHNTSVSNTISAVTMFPNASPTEVPVFKIAQNYNYPGSYINPKSTLTINGLLSVDSNKTLIITGDGERLLRNGITGEGDVVVAGLAQVKITGDAQLSGNGKISVDDAGALFQIAATSYTTLNNNKQITSAATNGISVQGTFNGLANSLSGNAEVSTQNASTIITAHTQGLGGLFATTGGKQYNPATNFVFNGNTAQNSGNANSITARTITVDNTQGLTLSNPVTVTDTLYIGKSNVTTSPAAVLTIDANGTIDGYSTSSFINGPLNMWVDSAAAQYYPIGKNTFGAINYHGGAVPAWVTLEYINNTPNTNGFDTAKRGQGLAAIAAAEYWKISASAPTSGNVEIPFTSNSATLGVDVLNIRVVSWDGTTWVSEGPKGRTATAGNVISDGLNNYGVFTIGIDSACTVPTAPAFTNLNVCTGDAINLNATGNGTVQWFINAADDQPFAAGNTINLGVLPTDTVFYAEIKNIGCYSNRVAYPVKINNIPAAPSITGATQLCYNTNTQLDADTAGTNNWYSNIADITPAYTGDAYTTAAFKNDTAFFVEKVENGCASTRTRVDVIVKAEILSPVSNGDEICAGSNGIIDAAANNTIRWYESNTAATPFFTGNRYITTALTADSTYYLEAFDGTCASTRQAVVAKVVAAPAAPTIASGTDVCEGSTTKITATATGTIYWYNNPTGAAVNSGTTFTTAPLFTNRTYYTSTFDGKCFSPKTAVNVNVFAVPASATITVASSVPAKQTTAIQTTGTAQNYEWDFGTDATPQTSTGAGPHNVSWATQGNKTITLKMWNGTTGVECSTQIVSNVRVGAGLGVNEIAGATLAIYPNPATTALNLDITFETEQAGTLQLTDATGKTVYSNAFANAAQINNTIDVSGLAKGLYMLKVATAKGVAVHKVVIQ